MKPNTHPSYHTDGKVRILRADRELAFVALYGRAPEEEIIAWLTMLELDLYRLHQLYMEEAEVEDDRRRAAMNAAELGSQI
jgi:hypothetical protein